MKEAGFKTDVRAARPPTPCKTGRVISTSPAENSQLEKGRTVVLVVSQGREQVACRTSSASSEDEARSALEDAGLRADVTEEESEDEDPGTVLRQDPASGEQVDKGSAVKLVVAKAPPDVEVPDVVDQERGRGAPGARRTRASRCGYATRPSTRLDQDGIVIDQDPAGGEQRRRARA